MLSKEVSSTILKVFGLTRPGIKARSAGPLANKVQFNCPKLVVLLLLGHMRGSIGVHHLWARPCFSGSHCNCYIIVDLWVSLGMFSLFNPWKDMQIILYGLCVSKGLQNARVQRVDKGSVKERVFFFFYFPSFILSFDFFFFLAFFSFLFLSFSCLFSVEVGLWHILILFYFRILLFLSIFTPPPVRSSRIWQKVNF